MAFNGISSSSNQLASLLRNTTLNNRMLKMAYKNLENINKNNHLNRTDLTENDPEKFIENLKPKYSAENEEALRKNTASMREASMNVLFSRKTSDEDFIKSVKDFAESYNSTVKTLKDSDNYVAVSSGINMVNTTRSYSVALERAGITVNDDNTLTVNEDAVKANIGHARSMFSGTYSFGGKTAKKASDLQSIAAFSGVGIYNRFGIFYGDKK